MIASKCVQDEIKSHDFRTTITINTTSLFKISRILVAVIHTKDKKEMTTPTPNNNRRFFFMLTYLRRYIFFVVITCLLICIFPSMYFVLFHLAILSNGIYSFRILHTHSSYLYIFVLFLVLSIILSVLFFDKIRTFLSQFT